MIGKEENTENHLIQNHNIYIIVKKPLYRRENGEGAAL